MKKIFKALGAVLTAVLMASNTCPVYAAEADALAALALQQAVLNQTLTGTTGGVTTAEELQKQQQAALQAVQQATVQSQIQAQQAAQSQQAAQKPAVQANASQQALIDAGTYIDVNKTTQTLSLFSGGQITYVTPVVTGNVRAGHSTPNGVYSIYAKQTNRTLKGPNYESFVKYWLPFYKGYGIHDANWRSSGEFGGATYQTSGSHGCVNVPPANMPSLFAAVGVGTPVIVHE